MCSNYSEKWEVRKDEPISLNMVDDGYNLYEWPLKANCEKIWPEIQAFLFSKPFWTFLLLSLDMKNGVRSL